MTNDKIIFFLCGIFGWTGTPATFQVQNRAIMHELLKAMMYVDDIIIVTRKANVNSDIDITNTGISMRHWHREEGGGA